MLALILAPIHRWLGRRLGARLAALVATMVGLLGLVLPLFAIGRAALIELGRLTTMMSSEGEVELQSLPGLQPAIDSWVARIGMEGLGVGAAVATWLQATPDFLMGRAFGLLAGMGGLAVQASVMTFTLFFLLRDDRQINALLHSLIPFDDGRTNELLRHGRDVISAVVYGNLLVAAVQGALGGLTFLALGLPAPALWGILMAIASLIPMLGAGIIWAPTALILLLTGSVFQGVVLLAVGMLLISTVDNVIRAIFVGTRAGVHPLVVLLGVFGGIVVFGTVGVFVGPVLMAEALLVLGMARAALYPEKRESPRRATVKRDDGENQPL